MIHNLKMQSAREYLHPDTIQTVVFHFPCADGCASANIAYLYNSKYHLVPWNLIDPLPSLQGNTVFIDCAPEQVQENQMVLDHHHTNYKRLHTQPGCFFNMAKSGCMLAWEYFFPDKEMPILYFHIGYRDLWNFTHPETRIVGYALMNMSLDYKTLHTLEIDDLLLKGRETICKINTRINSMKPLHVKIGSYETMVAKIPDYQFISECAEHLYTTFPNVPFVVVYYEHDDKYKLSFRTNKDSVNVAEIAQELFHGGGHAKAAGATISKHDFYESSI